jgi:hypothetical protein
MNLLVFLAALAAIYRPSTQGVDGRVSVYVKYVKVSSFKEQRVR